MLFTFRGKIARAVSVYEKADFFFVFCLVNCNIGRTVNKGRSLVAFKKSFYGILICNIKIILVYSEKGCAVFL